MNLAKTMHFYSIWSFLLGGALLIHQSIEYMSINQNHHEVLYIICVALFHFILGIWYSKGQKILVFAWRSIWARSVNGLFLLGVANHLIINQESLMLSKDWIEKILVYTLVVGVVELVSALMTWRHFQSSHGERTTKVIKMSFQSKNRYIFGIYLYILGLWLISDANSFLNLFYLPETIFLGFAGEFWMWGPMHFLGVQIIILGSFNVLAARKNLTPLIEAGVRGGMLASVFFLALVLAGLLHPITLLLPAADFISLLLIKVHRATVEQ